MVSYNKNDTKWCPFQIQSYEIFEPDYVSPGMFFVMTAASFFHAFANDYSDYGFYVILPLSYAALNIASWTLRPNSRKL
jgi:hypothetical protein